MGTHHTGGTIFKGYLKSLLAERENKFAQMIAALGYDIDLHM